MFSSETIVQKFIVWITIREACLVAIISLQEVLVLVSFLSVIWPLLRGSLYHKFVYMVLLLILICPFPIRVWKIRATSHFPCSFLFRKQFSIVISATIDWSWIMNALSRRIFEKAGSSGIEWYVEISLMAWL